MSSALEIIPTRVVLVVDTANVMGSRADGWWRYHRALGAAGMGVAISGMHYAGMIAARFPERVDKLVVIGEQQKGGRKPEKAQRSIENSVLSIEHPGKDQRNRDGRRRPGDGHHRSRNTSSTLGVPQMPQPVRPESRRLRVPAAAATSAGTSS